MNICSLRCRKKGSVIVIVIGVFVALLIIFGSLMKTTTSRVHTTKKLGDSTLAREFATSLAGLSNHYIKNVLLTDEKSQLRKALSLPLSDMKDESKEDITAKFKKCMSSNVKSGSEDVLSVLEKSSGLNKLKWTLAWHINKKDFSPIELDGKVPYPREKDGVVRTYIKVNYVLPGTKSPITEDYLFVSQIKVVANLIPVVSKFTLYVEDALCGQDSTRLNLVRTKATGDLQKGSYRPWVLDNGENSDKPVDTYKELVGSSRGLAYIGGGTKSEPVSLGIARGWNDTDAGSVGDYGEDFHFYKNSNAAEGYWKTIKLFGGGKGIMASDIGLCDDCSDDNLLAWQLQLGGYYDRASRKNSIFKLYGTDRKKSPTLVLGYVDAMYASVRIYKSPSDLNFLTYFDGEEDFLRAVGISTDGGVNNIGENSDILSLYNALGSSLGYDEYLKDYASKLCRHPYSKDYLYILTNNNTPNPKSLVNDGKLKSLAGYDNKDNVYTEIPDGYEKLINNAKLGDLSAFIDIDKLSLNGSKDSKNNKRIAYSTNVSSANEDIKSYFVKKGILVDGELNLNGWIYINCPDNLTIDINKFKVISHGGIIVDGGGDINIKGDVVCEKGAHLTLVTLAGKIVIEKNVKRCDATLIAGGGQVRLEGNSSDAELSINGNVAMKKIDSLEKLARGCKINYKDELSALPNCGSSNEKRSELPLLMFSFKDNPKMFD